MPKLKEHVDAWIERVERITKWTCPKETRHKVDVLGAKTRDEESRWRAQEIRRRTPGAENCEGRGKGGTGPQCAAVRTV